MLSGLKFKSSEVSILSFNEIEYKTNADGFIFPDSILFIFDLSNSHKLASSV